MKNKIKNTRLVTFEQDFGAFKKSEQHAMHHTLADKLVKANIKVKVKSIGLDEAKAKAEEIAKA